MTTARRSLLRLAVAAVILAGFLQVRLGPVLAAEPESEAPLQSGTAPTPAPEDGSEAQEAQLRIQVAVQKCLSRYGNDPRRLNRCLQAARAQDS